jgi:4-hydroxy-tetrahydrodipicolinate reductase
VLESAARLEGRTVLNVGEISLPAATDLAQLRPGPGTVLIDFSAPGATRTFAAQAASLGIKLVIGTTGLTAEDHSLLAATARQTAVLVASNMSLGVNVLLAVVEQLSSGLPGFDLEIVEMHHRRKKDAPSGTALALAEAAAKGRRVALSDVVCHGRHGMTGERPPGEIGVLALRGGDVVGEHTVIFAGDGERVELTHRAHSRDTFAAGALRAAQFLSDKDQGMFTMRDVLGLQTPAPPGRVSFSSG